MRILRNTLLALVALVILIVIALATPPGRAVVANVVAGAASGNGLTVAIEDMSGWPPFQFGVGRVVLSDPDGAFAEIDNLTAGLRLLPLLTGTVSLDGLAAERVAIARRPHLPAAKDGGGGGLVPFAVDSFSVAKLELGAGIAGRAAVLTLSGSASAAANGALAATLTANRIDGVAGKLAVTVTRADGSQPLTATLTLNEGADGILLGLMGRDSGPGYALTLDSGVSGGTVTGKASLKSEGAARFDGSFALTPKNGGGTRVTLDGTGDLAELVPPAYADLLSGPLTIAVDADVVRDPGKALPRIAIRKGTVTTGSVSAQASGTLGDAAANLALSLNVAKAGGGRIAVPGLADGGFDRVALKGTVAPKGKALRLDLTGNVAGLDVGGTAISNLGASLAVEARGDDPLASATLPFALRVEADAIKTKTGTVASSDAAPILLSADGTLDVAKAVATVSAKLQLAGGATDYSGTVSVGNVAGKATVAYADLAPLSPLAGQTLAGAISGSAEGTFVGDAAKITVAATTSDLDPGNATAAKLLAGKTDIAATITRASDGSLAVSGLKVAGAALQATGALTLGAESIDGNLDGAISDLALVAEASSGAVGFTAKISGARDRPTVEADLTVKRGKLLGQAIDDARAAFSGAPADSGWQGALTLAGGFGGKALSGTATVGLDATSGQLALPAIDVAIGGNHIKGGLTRTAAGLFDGTLTVDAPDLATLAALALTDAGGAATARVTFAPDGDKQRIAADFSGKGIAVGSATVGTVKGSVTVDDALGAPRLSGNVSATTITSGSVKLDTATLSAASTAGKTTFEAKAKGPDLDLAGTGNLDGETLTIATLSGSAYGSPVRLGSALALALAGGETGITNADLAIGGGHVRLNGSVQPKLDLTVAIAGVSAAVVNGFAPQLGAGGTVSGEVTVLGDDGGTPLHLAGGLARRGARRDTERRAAGADHLGARHRLGHRHKPRCDAQRRRAVADRVRVGAVQGHRALPRRCRRRAAGAAGARHDPRVAACRDREGGAQGQRRDVGPDGQRNDRPR